MMTSQVHAPMQPQQCSSLPLQMSRCCFGPEADATEAQNAGAPEVGAVLYSCCTADERAPGKALLLVAALLQLAAGPLYARSPLGDVSSAVAAPCRDGGRLLGNWRVFACRTAAPPEGSVWAGVGDGIVCYSTR